MTNLVDYLKERLQMGHKYFCTRCVETFASDSNNFSIKHVRNDVSGRHWVPEHINCNGEVKIFSLLDEGHMTVWPFGGRLSPEEVFTRPNQKDTKVGSPAFTATGFSRLIGGKDSSKLAKPGPSFSGKPAPSGSAAAENMNAGEENLEDELLEDDEGDHEEFNERDGGTDVAHSLAQAGLNVGHFLRSGEGDLNLGTDDADEKSKESSMRRELENIYKVLTRTRDKLEVENSDEISDDIRSNFEQYKAHMEDITPGKDGGVFKRVLQPGTGASAGMGKIVKFHYNSYIEDQDEPFDTSLLRGQTQKAKLGESELIAGLELGLTTMKEGELADFVIDYTNAYGLYGAPPMIPPKCTIRITVRLVECSDQDPVDAMTMDQRSELPYKETVAYIERKLDQGKLQFGRGKLNAAINRYKDARLHAEMDKSDWTEEEKLEMKKYRIRLYKNLGKCYVKLSMPAKVLVYLKKLDEMGVKDSVVNFLRAKVHFMKGEYDEAVEELRGARVLEPGNAEINKFMALLLKEKNAYDEKSKKQAKRMLFDKPAKGGGDADAGQEKLD